MKPNRISLLAPALLATLAVPAHAAITLDGPWYTGSAAATDGTPSFDPNRNSADFTWGSGTADGGSSSRRGGLWTYFDDQSLANDGDRVKLSFTAEWPVTPNASGRAFRFGLFDHGGTTLEADLDGSNSDPAFDGSVGYFATINLGGGGDTNAGSLLFSREIGGTNPVSINDTDNTAKVGFIENLDLTAANTPHNFSLEILRNSSTEYQMTVIAGGGSATVTMTDNDDGGINNITADKVNTFYLLNTPGNDLDSITFSNFEVIPEPSTALLGGLGLLALLRRRRS